jgi:hypothetical protein
MRLELTGLLVQARSMLRRKLPGRWKRELMHMLFTRRKAEIEVLSSVPHNPDELHPLVRYLGDRIWGCMLALETVPRSWIQKPDGEVEEPLYEL